MMGADPNKLEQLVKKYQDLQPTFSGAGRKLTGHDLANVCFIVLLAMALQEEPFHQKVLCQVSVLLFWCL